MTVSLDNRTMDNKNNRTQNKTLVVGKIERMAKEAF